MNSRAFGAQNKMSQFPDLLDFTPTHPLNSSIHGPFAQRPESTPPTPGLWGSNSLNNVDNGVAPILSLEKDFCSNFSCCGLQLADMHQLLDHFEEAHVVVLGGDGSPVYPSLNDNSPVTPAFASAPANALSGGNQPGMSSLVVGYPQPYPPADAPFQYPSIDTNFLLPAGQSQQPSFSSALDSPLDLDFMSQSQLSQSSFDPFHLDFDFDSLQTRPSSPSASSTFSTPSLAWSDSSLSSASSAQPFGALGALGAQSLPGSGYSSPGYSSPTSGLSMGMNSDVESICLPPALLTIQPQSVPASAASSALPSARSSPDPMPSPASQQQQQPPAPQQQPAKKEHSDVEESREKEKRTTVGKIKAKIFGGSSRSERRTKSDGYSKKRDPRREKAYKCPRPGCIKSYLNPNGLKYHLEKGTCIIDPLYRPPSQETLPPAAPSLTTASLNASNPLNPLKRASSETQSLPQLGRLPTPLLPVNVKSEPASPPLAAVGIGRTGLRAVQAAQQQSQQQQGQQGQQGGASPYYYAYSFPFQYSTNAQIPPNQQ